MFLSKYFQQIFIQSNNYKSRKLKTNKLLFRSVETVHFVVAKCPAAKEAAASIRKKNKQKMLKIV